VRENQSLAKITRPLSIRVKSHKALLPHGRSKNGYGEHQSLDTLADLGSAVSGRHRVRLRRNLGVWR
jgi:hypothetical protein